MISTRSTRRAAQRVPKAGDRRSSECARISATEAPTNRTRPRRTAHRSGPRRSTSPSSVSAGRRTPRSTFPTKLARRSRTSRPTGARLKRPGTSSSDSGKRSTPSLPRSSTDGWLASFPRAGRNRSRRLPRTTDLWPRGRLRGRCSTPLHRSFRRWWAARRISPARTIPGLQMWRLSPRPRQRAATSTSAFASTPWRPPATA